MEQWAILSGIEGNLAAYEAVLAEIRRHRQPVTDLYVLGDVVGLQGDNEAVVQRLQSPRAGEPIPQVCTGWWEEQCFSLYGLGGLPDAPELREWGGMAAVERLWQSVSRKTVYWLRSQHFGFHELDCLLIHGSTLGYGDELTPDTPAIQLCDRIIRADANHLFCGRSGLAFECWIEPTHLHASLTTLTDTQVEPAYQRPSQRIVGVGNVGRNPGEGTYVLYTPATQTVTFKTVKYPQAKGFAVKRVS